MPQRRIIGSVAVTVAGCIIAGIGDFSFDLKGYFFALMSCTLQASYLLLVERSGAKQGISTSELLMYNAVLSLPFLLVAILVSGEATRATTAFAAAAGALGSPTSAAGMLLACSIAGMLLNFSMFLCTMHNSALTTTIVGVLKVGSKIKIVFYFSFIPSKKKEKDK
jgi:solute carrier family 35